MLFALKSAAWLSLAFLVIQPGGARLGDAAGALGSHALAAGQSVALGAVASYSCDTLECAGGKLVVSHMLKAPEEAGDAAPPAPPAFIPYPRPRPDRRG